MKKLFALPILLSALTIAGFASISVSAPTNGATVQSPVQFNASASSYSKITGMVIYVDSNVAYSTTAASLNTKIAMSTGQHSVVVRAWNSQGKMYSDWMTLQVGSSATTAPLTITTTSVPGATAGKSYSTTMAATGGTAPYKWSLASGQLPAGLTLSTSGVISGTPTASGNFSFTVDVNDSASHLASYSESMAVTAAGALSINATTLGGATSGTPYSATLSATGGIPAYTWSVASGALPTGLTLSSSGAITGTPTAAGTFNFVAQVRDSEASPITASKAESIVVTSASTTVAPPPQAAGYTVKFADDFTTLNVSPNREGAYNWYEGIWWNSTLAPSSNTTASNSILTLNWQKGQGPSTTDLSGCSKSGANCHAFRYGYFEARMKWNPTTGSWPAFWLLPVQSITGQAESGEIDVFEGQGSTPNMFFGTIHDWISGKDIKNNSGANSYTLPSNVDMTQFHTYGVLWVPGKITWYFDNQALYSAATYPIYDQQDYYPVLSTQEGANWSYGNMTGVSATTIPLNVDWVHIFQK